MGYKVGDEVLLKVAFLRYSNGDMIFDFTGADGERHKICPSYKTIYKEPEMTAEEAWDIAKKLFADYSDTKLDNIFGKGWSFPKLMELTPQEAKSRIEAWETENEIKIGDEVEFDDTANDLHRSMYVTSKYNDTDYCGICRNGDTYCVHKSALKKTGRNIDIEELLKQIGGDE